MNKIKKIQKSQVIKILFITVFVIGIVYEIAFLIDSINLSMLIKFPLLYIINYELANRMDTNMGLSIMYLLRLSILAVVLYVVKDKKTIRIKTKLLMLTRIIIVLTILSYELCLFYMYRYNGSVVTIGLDALNNINSIIIIILLIIEAILYILLVIGTKQKIRLIFILGLCAQILLPVIIWMPATFLLLNSIQGVRPFYMLSQVLFTVSYVLAISLIRNNKAKTIENNAGI